MKRVLLISLLVFTAFAIWYFSSSKSNLKTKSQKETPLTVKNHSDSFNGSIDKVIAAYLDTKNGFVDGDTTVAKKNARIMIVLLDSIPLQELKSDKPGIFETADANLKDIKANIESLVKQTDITEMRHDFSMITDMMYPSFFKTINYEGQSLYLQNCPMAFGDEEGANWISNSDEIVNPYLGKNHPKYKGTMLHCGEVKDSIIAK